MAVDSIGSQYQNYSPTQLKGQQLGQSDFLRLMTAQLSSLLFSPILGFVAALLLMWIMRVVFQRNKKLFVAPDTGAPPPRVRSKRLPRRRHCRSRGPTRCSSTSGRPGYASPTCC